MRTRAERTTKHTGVEATPARQARRRPSSHRASPRSAIRIVKRPPSIVTANGDGERR
ncbi:hypothetical protein BURPS1710A_1393 [Burkholderia pseudomallei 1710a]|uniref:Uncharacterized protein n=1 Tax=Burkholderia pseudomallei 1710a TaxID=320371 RepID=A0A0E1W3K3_BURPE|nr:hypothetical protein BURPS1710A_1393 [Burkholderia pseudomallei 1710a]